MVDPPLRFRRHALLLHAHELEGECWQVATPAGSVLLTVHAAPYWIARRMAEAAAGMVAGGVSLYRSATCCRSWTLGATPESRIARRFAPVDPIVSELVAAVRAVVTEARQLWGPNAPEIVKRLGASLDAYDAANPAPPASAEGGTPA